MENISESDFKWYTIQSFGIGGNKLKEQIFNVFDNHQLNDYLEDMLVPTKDVIEVKDGKQVISEQSLYPGYTFIKVNLTKEVLALIISLPKVLSIVNDGNNPIPLTDEDLKKIQDKISNKGVAVPKYNFETGDIIRILEGPFANFTGTVSKYDLNSGLLDTEVSIFGRNTPVEIHFAKVELIDE